MLWETLFQKERKTAPELLLALVILVALSDLAPKGTWRINGLCYWFPAALGIPFL